MFQIRNAGQHVQQYAYRILVASLVLLLIVSGCGSNTGTSATANQQEQPLRDNTNHGGADVQAISFADAATKPDIYNNAFIVLEGKISKIISPEAFVLADPPDPNNVVLVLTNTPDTPTTAGYQREIGTVLEVTGYLHPLDLSTLKQNYGVTLTSDQLADYKGKALLAAKRISPPSAEPTKKP